MFSILSKINKNFTSIKYSYILPVYILWDHPYITSLFFKVSSNRQPPIFGTLPLPYNYKIVIVLPCGSTKSLLYIGISPYAFFYLALRYAFGELFAL